MQLQLCKATRTMQLEKRVKVWRGCGGCVWWAGLNLDYTDNEKHLSKC